jgi:hypothetical protein
MAFSFLSHRGNLMAFLFFEYGQSSPPKEGGDSERGIGKWQSQRE